MADTTDAVSDVATLGIVAIIGYMVFKFAPSLRGLDDAAGGVVEGVRETAEPVYSTGTDVVQVYRGATGQAETLPSGQTVGGPRLITGGRLGNQIRGVTSRIFGGADPGFVRLNGQIVAVDEWDNPIKGVAPLKPGDRFGDERYTGTGF